MRLKAISLAVIPAAFLGVIASAPSASAWAPGNCQVGSFCVWPEYWYGDTDMTPSLETEAEWSGSAVGHIFYNNTSQDATMRYVVAEGNGQGREYTGCVSPHAGSYFTQKMHVTSVTWGSDGSSPCW
ncbi:hypothetical protein ACH4GE_36100 [Streptomyces tendae]|uniref:hypothetical protein n=1 Tax=Streptomyces tendae TaxID=1932 RepID=UPI0037B125F5